MGGKNPYVVFADADLERAAETAGARAFSNQGQICLCGSRILVEAPAYDRFRELFLARVARLRPGDPALPETEFGAIVSREQFDKVMGCIALAARRRRQAAARRQVPSRSRAAAATAGSSSRRCSRDCRRPAAPTPRRSSGRS
jgi:acyl-CoA reductase-like NAD-dependent aldehyde dehydrogenase